MRAETEQDLAKYHRMVGKRVFKKSNAAFKSRLHVATPSGVIVHPITGRSAFVFSDCESYVECRTCRLDVASPEVYTGDMLQLLESGVEPATVRDLVSRHLTALDQLPPNTPGRDEAIQSFGQLESDLIAIQGKEAVYERV